MAIRLQKVLPYIINEDQIGYIKHRFIGQNIRIIEDVVYFTEIENLPGIILKIDFERAFDSISWNSIDNALRLFNLGFRKWVKIVYTYFQTTILNNGYISEWFSPTQGIRHGCPLLAYLLLLQQKL